VAGRGRRFARALEVTRVARQARVARVLREVGLVGDKPATAEAAHEFRVALERLGTTFIKLGQLLSSRPDLLPDVYIEELGRLVDEVPPVPYVELEPAIRADLGPDVFVRVDPEPLATASIAQIHGAILKDGREVVVKVRRPGVLEQVEVDLALVRSGAGLAERASEVARLVQLAALADELEAHLRAELDLAAEAENTETIARLLADYDDLVVPAVVRPWVSERVLVLERIDGKKLAPGHGIPAERAAELARTFFRAYVRQVTLAGVYHADPHRGNVLHTSDDRLALLDFGLIGRLDDDTRRTLALLLMAVAQNRADGVADLILELSLTSLDSDEPGFVHELRRTLPRYQGRRLAGIRAGEALAELQRSAVRHGIRLPTSFALVAKTLSQADSIARTLDPTLDPVSLLEEDALAVVWSEAERRLEPSRLASLAFSQLEPLGRLPRKTVQLVERLESGTLKIGVAPTDLRPLDSVLRSTANRLGAALIVVGLLVSSALMARVDDRVALAGFLVSAALALYLFWKIVRTPGEL
jgi:ubiquinone biosynthesis protein